VFLNYPFDEDFASLANAMAFAVVAAGLLPVCARDLTVPDKPRLETLLEVIRNCQYSAHDFSRFTGEGPTNLARMNMPIEMGMAVFFALDTQHRNHRCAFFVSTPHDYQAFASDLAGLDPKYHASDEMRLLVEMYEWLRAVVPASLFNSIPSTEVVAKFRDFKERLTYVNCTGTDGRPSHDETREVMYELCAQHGWWDWRGTRMGKEEFPPIPIDWKAAQPVLDAPMCAECGMVMVREGTFYRCSSCASTNGGV
jgi:hypothetical protein